MTTTVSGEALVHVLTDLFVLLGHLNADTFYVQADETSRTWLAFVSRLQIYASHPGMTGLPQGALVEIETRFAVTCESYWARCASVTRPE